MRKPVDHRPGLQTDDNLFDFFHPHVDRVVEEHGRPVGEEGVFYLTSLLVERAHPDAQAPEEAAATLVELRIQAAQGDRPKAIRAYRSLGDRALVTAGFFRQSLSGRLVSRQYYVDMGAAAYDALAGLLRAAGFGGRRVGEGGSAGEGGHKGLDDIYQELAEAFEACSEVLAEVHDAVRGEDEGRLSDGDIVALYEQWRATGNPRLAARLARLGVVPARGGGDRAC
ncbi:hypothetical protein L6R53_15945 [Myxococcota bacterium]|nr:hypothetical protein [Myxococcota bacterium]